MKSEFTPKVGAINHEATGKPTITGDLETGAELTAATTGIQDQNGLPGTFAYQWFRSDGTGYAPIDRATESTYILASEDVGRRVKVRVTFTDNDGFSESLESDHTSPVAAKNIAATGKPTISGELRTGATLEADISGIADQNGLPDTFAYQWFRSDGTNDTPIDEATKSSYTLASEDGGQRIKVQVTFTDKNGFPESRDSDLTAVINHSATGRPTISGSLVVGGTLTADPSEIADRNGLPGAFSYQWHHGAGDTPIAGATGSTYALTESDKGKSIRVEVSFVDSDGNRETLSSDLTEEVAAVDHPATGAVTVQGVLETGKTLRADTTDIADLNGLPPASSFRYQWFRGTGADETEINGAIESNYNLVSEDAGHHMKVVVSFTDKDGFEESIPSAFTQGTVLEVSVLTTEEGYAPRKLTFLDYRPENFLSWRNPSRAPYPSYHDDNEVVHRFEVQRRTRDLGQAWTGWEGLSLPEPPPRDSYNAVKLVVDGAGRCQDREWRVRALYNDPQRHSEWVIAGEHNRPADGPPGGAVPAVAGSWLTVVGDSYQLGFSWRTVSRNCAWGHRLGRGAAPSPGVVVQLHRTRRGGETPEPPEQRGGSLLGLEHHDPRRQQCLDQVGEPLRGRRGRGRPPSRRPAPDPQLSRQYRLPVPVAFPERTRPQPLVHADDVRPGHSRPRPLRVSLRSMTNLTPRGRGIERPREAGGARCGGPPRRGCESAALVCR